MEIDVCGITDTGLVRSGNEDQFLVARIEQHMVIEHTSLSAGQARRFMPDLRAHAFMVADGVGGQQAGERASAIVVQSMQHYLQNTIPWCLTIDPRSEELFVDELARGIERCQEKISADVEANEANRGMSTTLTLGYVVWPKLFLVHVGDSRCYLLRDDQLECLTRDHTVAQRLVEEGVLEPEEAEASPLSHVLWNAIGDRYTDPRAQLIVTDLNAGDALLFCSDGLNKHVPDSEISELLAAGAPVEETCDTLVAAANAAGGTDNITVVVARFKESD